LENFLPRVASNALFFSVGFFLVTHKQVERDLVRFRREEKYECVLESQQEREIARAVREMTQEQRKGARDGARTPR
jgi:hypothetical protein